MDEDPTIREHRVRQAERAAAEHKEEQATDSPDAAEQHGRRAEKADYLREKLEEREKAERDTRGA